ncbi:MAG: hypothetical protein CM15mP120_11050 [Pseudomonadota bacterium]|nr:MAG: hypothetical protein CM15mP120_11050 [Pseudomonadota bacterium]
MGVHSALLQLSLNPKLPPHAGNGQINALFFVAADMAQGDAQRALGIVACFCEQIASRVRLGHWACGCDPLAALLGSGNHFWCEGFSRSSTRAQHLIGEQVLIHTEARAVRTRTSSKGGRRVLNTKYIIDNNGAWRDLLHDFLRRAQARLRENSRWRVVHHCDSGCKRPAHWQMVDNERAVSTQNRQNAGYCAFRCKPRVANGPKGIAPLDPQCSGLVHAPTLSMTCCGTGNASGQQSSGRNGYGAAELHNQRMRSLAVYP